MVFTGVACSTLTPAERAERAARKAALVEKVLADRHYTIDVQMMYPQQDLRGMSLVIIRWR